MIGSFQDSEMDGAVTGINVTPLVDIMLVLLIIFMVTAHFVSDTGFKVNLPKASAGQARPTEALTVMLDKAGNLRLMEHAVDLNGLKANLAKEAQLNPGVRVTLAADGSLSYQQVVAVLDAIKLSGVMRVALTAEK